MRRHLPHGVADALPLERRRNERVLAVARAFLATSALVASSFFGPQSARYAPAAIPLLAGYVIFALAIIALHVRSQPWAVPPLAMHIVDTSVVVATLLTAGAGGPFFLLFVFTLLAAGYRWGFRETVITAAVAVGSLALQAILTTWLPVWASAKEQLEADHLVILSTLLLLAGVFTGYLAHREKESRTQAVSIATIIGRVDARVGLKQTMAAVLDAVLRLFHANRALLVVREVDSDQLFMWDVQRTKDVSPHPVRSSQLRAGSGPVYMFAPAASAWHAVQRSTPRGTRLDVVALDRHGSRTVMDAAELPADFLETVRPFRQLMAFHIELGEMVGRLILVDPRTGFDREDVLGFGQRLVRQVGLSVYNVYLLHRLRARATAIERARLGRELHDGIIQAVMGVQIQLAALSFRVARESPAVAGELRRLDGILKQEVVSLRDLMQQMRPLDVGPEQLVDTLADLVDQFQRETGIAARFVTQLDRVDLPPPACRELARILQEALVNVRKHSGARNVLVRFAVTDGDCTLLIEDDGRGFQFNGRLSHGELMKSREGPRVIKERVRLAGGKLTVESVPGRGSRLDIAVPLSIHENQG